MIKPVKLALVLALLSGCISEPTINKEPVKSATIIFINPIEQSQYQLPTGSKFGSESPNYFWFVNSVGVLEGYRPGGITDSILIPTHDLSHIEFLHGYSALEDVGFLVKAGDTVTIKYNANGYPVLQSNISAQLSGCYNYKLPFRNSHKYFGFDPVAIYTNYYFMRINKAKQNGEAIPEIFLKDFIDFVKLNDDITANWELQRLTLDSLIEAKQVEPVYGNYQNYTTQREQLAVAASNKYFAYDAETFSRINNMYKEFFNDSLVAYASYHRVLKAFIHHQARGSEVKMIRTSSGSTFDYPEVSEIIKDRVDIPQQTKELILYYTLEYIVNFFNTESIKEYSDMFLKETADTLKFQYMSQLYNMGIQPTYDLLLKASDNAQIELSSLAKNHNGKVLYIDFWASWCAPCRASMPYAKELRNEYEGKGVVFIYLAFNDREKEWREAIQTLELDSNCENYFIVNPKTSKMIETLNITNIPRYMIYSKEGKLVNPNAPGPEGAEIRELLDRYLGE